MAERVIGLGDIEHHPPESPWVVVFGGVTREGNRRARRAINAALEADLSVVWFDGFSERWDDRRIGDRVPIDMPVPDEAVVVVDYEEVERRHWLTRVIEGTPSALIKPLENAEERVSSKRGSRVSFLTSTRRLAQKFMALVYKKVLRRLFLIFRGVVGWRIVADDVRRLSGSTSAPRQIVYGDDFSLTIAWHAARLWPETPTGMELTAE